MRNNQRALSSLLLISSSIEKIIILLLNSALMMIVWTNFFRRWFFDVAIRSFLLIVILYNQLLNGLCYELLTLLVVMFAISRISISVVLLDRCEQLKLILLALLFDIDIRWWWFGIRRETFVVLANDTNIRAISDAFIVIPHPHNHLLAFNADLFITWAKVGRRLTLLLLLLTLLLLILHGTKLLKIVALAWHYLRTSNLRSPLRMWISCCIGVEISDLSSLNRWLGRNCYAHSVWAFPTT